MSGGYFDYDRLSLEYIAEEIEEIVNTNECEEIDEYGDTLGRFYPPEIVEKLRDTVAELRKMYYKVKHIDYLLSGDYGEGTFLERWDDE
jgi:hypothetical protein